MLTSIILRYVARNVDSIVSFINKLDASLDAYMAKHDLEVAGFEQDIEDVIGRAKADAASIIATAEDKAAHLRALISHKAQSAATVAAIKAALPTG